MAALTAQQVDFFAQLQVSYDAFVAALTTALEVDNDPTTTLPALAPARTALTSASFDFSRRIGVQALNSAFTLRVPNVNGGTFLPVQRVVFTVNRGTVSSSENIPRE